MEPFFTRLQKQIENKRSILCVGLDPVDNRIPETFQGSASGHLQFAKEIIDATYDIACCFKPNLAFYTVFGAEGIQTLSEIIGHAHHYDVPVILDAKFGDIGHTAQHYAKSAFETLQADAVTVNPYMGEDAIDPFRQYEDRGIFVLCLTSNSSRKDIQILPTRYDDKEQELYEVVAQKINEWNQCQNLGAVIGATAPDHLESLRSRLDASVPILCPGIGAQGGDLEEVLWAGCAQHHKLIINVSRTILFASAGQDYAEAARREATMFVEQMYTFFEQAEEDRVQSEDCN